MVCMSIQSIQVHVSIYCVVIQAHQRDFIPRVDATISEVSDVPHGNGQDVDL